MIKFKLAELLEEQGKTRYWLSKEAKIDNCAIDKIYKNKSTQIKLETILKITQALNCNIEDLITIEKDSKDE